MKDRLVALKKTFVLLHIAAAAALLLFLWAARLAEGLGMRCLFLQFFGLYCPGCGGTRALYALLQGRLLAAFLYYPALPVTVVILLSYDVRMLLSLLRGQMRYADGIDRRWLWLIPAVMLGYAVLRNVLLLCFDLDVLALCPLPTLLPGVV
ncbi:MAG: DUF2752 domain-containing protein [Eubacteriales bacterium]